MITAIPEVRGYLRIDDGAEDSLLQTLIDAAESYLANATGKTFDADNALARLFCLVLVSDWYENRQMIGRVSDKTRATVEGILMQLKYCEPVTTESTVV